MATRIRRTTKPQITYKPPAPAWQPQAAPAPVTGPPPDPTFIAQQNAANRGLALGSAWDQYSLGQIENDYGLGSDVSNPYSRAKLLEDSYHNQQRGTLNSATNLYSGAMQDRQDTNARNYAIGYDQLRRQYQGQKAGVLRGAVDRYSSTLGNVSQQDLDSLLRQLGAL